MINARRVAATALGGAFFLVWCVCAKDNAELVVTPKKGIAAASFGPAAIATANASWYYNWRNTPNSGTVPSGVTAPEYVPMLSNAGIVTDANINALKTAQANGTYKYLLGFNEPDLSSQANMTVTQAINLWPKLISTGLILGSPAPSYPAAWFDTFMTQAAALNFRIDFVCLHYYQPPNTATSVSSLKTFLTNAYNKYKKPIWLTEFGAPDCKTLGWCGGGTAAALTQAQVDAFVPQVITMLEDMPYVQRYAWFVDASQAGFELSAVFNSGGALTQTGIDVRDAHGTASVRNNPGELSDKGVHGPLFVRANGAIVCDLPARQTHYRVKLFNAAGRLAASFSGSGMGEITLNHTTLKLTSGFYAGQLDIGGVTMQARIVIE
jgi:hypothetical protein